MLDAIPKKLIIVGNEDTDVYCEYLSMLVSTIKAISADNGEENTESRTQIDTAIWTDKIYCDNRAHTSSRQKMLFVGDDGCAKNVAMNIQMNVEEMEYGIYFGWLGNKAIIYVDESIMQKDAKLYSEFLNKNKVLSERFNNRVERAVSKKTKGQKTWATVLGNIVLPGIGTAVIPLINWSDDKKIKSDQAYRYAVLKFFLDYLDDFMR